MEIDWSVGQTLQTLKRLNLDDNTLVMFTSDSGHWKLHFPHSYRSLQGEPGSGGQPGPYVQKTIELATLDLKNDTGETQNVADKHADIVAWLKSLAERARDDLGDSLTNRPGKNGRPDGRLR